MKITIYELLALVKDGKAPEKIKFRNEIYEYESRIEDNFMDYVGIEKETNTKFYLSSHIGDNYISDIFTDEVEIIEEDKKIEYEQIEELTCNEYDFEKKTINLLIKNQMKLIDEINNLKEK